MSKESGTDQEGLAARFAAGLLRNRGRKWAEGVGVCNHILSPVVHLQLLGQSYLCRSTHAVRDICW